MWETKSKVKMFGGRKIEKDEERDRENYLSLYIDR